MQKSYYKKVFSCYINGTRGVISLFLAILMVPFISIAGALLNAARINSATAVFDEALCNASNSTLGTYDSFLKKRFGLLAMSQNTASQGGGYTAQNLISDTFKFYMEQNLGVLSNTYVSGDSSAVGVYPLADTDVLLSEVLEYSKYTVPTKLVIDGLSIDSIISELTKSLKIGENVLNTVNSSETLSNSLDACDKKMEALLNKFDDYESKKTAYAGEYSDFAAAVVDYNDLVEKRNRDVAECEAEAAAAQAAYDASYDSETGTYSAAAESALQEAKDKLQETIDKYHELLVSKRSAVTGDKTDYVSAITDYANAIKSLGDAVVAAQNSAAAVRSASDSLMGNTVKTLVQAEKDTIDKNISTLKENKKQAETRGDSAAVSGFEADIQAQNDKKADTGNAGTLFSAVNSAESEAANSLNRFATENYIARFTERYDQVVELRNKVRDKYTVPDGDDEYAEGTAGYYNNYNMPLTKAAVVELLENLGKEVAKSSFFAIFRALIGFIKALFTLSIWFDPLLCANISNSQYSSIGGLPSNKNRSSTPLMSAEEKQMLEADKKRSEDYKALIGAYSSDSLTIQSASTVESMLDTLMDDINDISECLDNMEGNLLKILYYLGRLVVCTVSMVGHLLGLIKQLAQMFLESAYEKILLAGYIGYNVPNRTTYTGFALTGQRYNLPRLESSNQGLAFYGAETEYIIMGGTSEILNQTLMFHVVLLLRLGFNIPAVVSSAEVQSVAAAAGAPTFGIGLVLVYLLYTVAESFADTLLLVNGSEVPIIKTKPYLTPSGLWGFAEKFVKVKLNDAQKAVVNQQIIGLLNGVSSDGDDITDRYNSALKDYSELKPEQEHKIRDMFQIDYTQMLIFTMMVFKSGSSLLEGLSDVIQMEAAYNSKVNEIGSYTFDLDKSYTYLRASGSFTTNEFIRLSDRDALNSTERIVYRGY